MLDELIGHKFERFIPAGRLELAIATDQWLGESITVVDVLEHETTPDAQHALAGGILWLIVGSDDRVDGGNVQLDCTPDTAVRAGRVDAFDRLGADLFGVDRTR